MTPTAPVYDALALAVTPFGCGGSIPDHAQPSDGGPNLEGDLPCWVGECG
jgi:hypothetical protein